MGYMGFSTGSIPLTINDIIDDFLKKNDATSEILSLKWNMRRVSLRLSEGFRLSMNIRTTPTSRGSRLESVALFQTTKIAKFIPIERAVYSNYLVVNKPKLNMNLDIDRALVELSKITRADLEQTVEKWLRRVM